jgi:ComF family protein
LKRFTEQYFNKTTGMVKTWCDALVHVFYPSLCFGCNAELVQVNQFVCLQCLNQLGLTHFESMRENPVEKLFWGRAEIPFAASTFYYIDNTPLQQIIHHIKYRQEKELGIHMGEIMGIHGSGLFTAFTTDLCIPMPLHPRKEYKRGYNQASLLCEGIFRQTGIPYSERALVRNENTRTQTKKSRTERWENVAAAFDISDASIIKGKHVVVVDDVITTGASTEACVNTLKDHGAKSVGIYSLAFTI